MNQNAPVALPFADEVRRCRAAHDEWKKLPTSQRLRHIKRLRRLLAERGEELALNVTQDIGRQADEVLATDVLPTADACRFLERHAARILRSQTVSTTRRPLWLFGTRDVIHRRPHGIVGIIGTWNYPIFLNVVQIVHALAAGNGVLWKPSELIPATAKLVDTMFRLAGFPEGLFQTLPTSREAGPQLAEADIDHVVFTGSADIGRKLAKRLGERLISSTLELSGCDAMIVTANADLDLASKAAWFGCNINSGQTCLAVRRVFVQKDRYGEFLDRLKTLAGHPRDSVVAMFSQAQQAESLVSDALAKGGKLLIANEAKAADNPPRFPPTVIMDANPEMAVCRDAAFAPVMAVMPFGTLPEVVQMVRRCDYGLGASIFTAYPPTAEQLIAMLDVGMVTINDVIAPTAHPATPFGGRKLSGWGATQGEEGLLNMTVPQVVTTRNGDFRPHYDTATTSDPAMKEMVRGMLRWSHGGGWKNAWRGFWSMIRAARAGFGKKKAAD